MNIQPIALVQSLLGITGAATSAKSALSSFSSSQSSGAGKIGAASDTSAASIRETPPLLHESFKGFLNAQIERITTQSAGMEAGQAGLAPGNVDGSNLIGLGLKASLPVVSRSKGEPGGLEVGASGASGNAIPGDTEKDAAVDDKSLAFLLAMFSSPVNPAAQVAGRTTGSLPESVVKTGSSTNLPALRSMMERLKSALQKLIDLLETSEGKDAGAAKQVSTESSLGDLAEISASSAEKALAETTEPAFLPDAVYSFASAGNTSKSLLNRAELSENAIAGKNGMLERLAETVEKLVKELDEAGGDASSRSALQQLLHARTLGQDAALNRVDSQADGFKQIMSTEQMALVRTESLRQTQAVLSDMLERMRGEVTFNSKSQQAIIHLDPPALGRLQVHMTVDDTQRVVALIQADKSATQDFLRQNQEDLRRGLRDQGFDPERTEIRVVDPDATKFSWRLYDTLSAA